MVSADGPPALLDDSSKRLLHVRFGDIARADWDRLYVVAPGATPFSSWTFQRAWWDAFAATAEEHYLVLEAGAIVGIAPLMVRQEPAPRHRARPGPAPGPLAGLSGHDSPSRRTLYFGASYHADYATLLAARVDLPPLAAMLALHVVEQLKRGVWDAVDLRRLAQDDPARGVLERALRDTAQPAGLEVRLEPEDVCPTVDLADDWHAQLQRLDKKTRHEIRRKLRRAERAGHVELHYRPLDDASVDRFVRLHQARWGSSGLFAAGEDGDRNRHFLRRLAELEAAEGPLARFHLAEVAVGGQTVHALAGFADRGTCYFYNAGMDPEARDLSPGIVGTAAYLRDRLERGDRCFDFLRGNEAYKYEWGASDRNLTRLVVEPATTA
jgi:CelD/BcsL family acetyltransferase involved in cellulose biosynthesis